MNRLEAIRALVERRQRDGPHWDGCETEHLDCAVLKLLEVAEAAIGVRDYRHATPDGVSYPIEIYTAWHRLGKVLDKLTVEIPE